MPERIQLLAVHGPEYVRTVSAAARLAGNEDPRVAAALELVEVELMVRQKPSWRWEIVITVLAAYLVVELRARGYLMSWHSATAAGQAQLLQRPEVERTKLLHPRLARIAAVMADDLLALGLVVREPDEDRPEVDRG